MEFCENSTAIPGGPPGIINQHFYRGLVYNYCRYCNHSQTAEFTARADNNSCQFQCQTDHCGSDGQCYKYGGFNVCKCNGLWGNSCDAFTYFWNPFFLALQYIFFFAAVVVAVISTFFSCIPEVVDRIKRCRDYSLKTLSVFVVWLLTMCCAFGWMFRLIYFYQVYDAFLILSDIAEAALLLLLAASLWCVIILW